MKTIKIACIALCFFISKMNAQQQAIDCNVKLNKALQLLKEEDKSEQLINQSIELLLPCANKGEDTAQLLLSRVYLLTDNQEKHKEAFKLLSNLAENDNPLAVIDLGLLYKYGKGCNLNFNKARDWFEKASEQGNSTASYSLGYLYLKGFGNIEQDYGKAVEWFEKSNHSMAKYWLGVCYYYGYGITKDITKANELLGTNFSVTNTTTEDSGINSTNSSSEESNTNLTDENDAATTNVNLGQDTSLNGIWKGQILVFDWAGKNIEQKLPVELEITYNEEELDFSVVWNVNEKDKNFDFTVIDDTLFYDDLQITLPHTSFSEHVPNELQHDIISVDFSKKTVDNKEFLIANLESFIKDWNEPAAPIKMVLQHKKTFANKDAELSDDALEALTLQQTQFIKLYPNPFQNDLIVSYALETEATTKVTIADINGANEQVITPSTVQKAGEYHYYVNGGQFKKGMYIVSVFVDNERKTRIIVKK